MRTRPDRGPEFPPPAGPVARGGRDVRGDRALPTLRIPACGSAPGTGDRPARRPAAPDRGAGGAGRPEDPARRGAAARALGPPDDRRGAAREHRPVHGRLLTGMNRVAPRSLLGSRCQHALTWAERPRITDDISGRPGTRL